MSLPTDFNDPMYGHVKQDILGMLTGPLAYPGLSEESALRKVRQHCGAEYGYSDELVRSIPAWKTRFKHEEPSQPTEEEENAKKLIHTPKDDKNKKS